MKNLLVQTESLFFFVYAVMFSPYTSGGFKLCFADPTPSPRPVRSTIKPQTNVFEAHSLFTDGPNSCVQSTDINTKILYIFVSVGAACTTEDKSQLYPRPGCGLHFTAVSRFPRYDNTTRPRCVLLFFSFSNLQRARVQAACT